MAKQAIHHGETMTISMNIFGSNTDYVSFNISCFDQIASIYKQVAHNLSFFRTDKCFKLGWPMDKKADFFVQPDKPDKPDKPASNASPLPVQNTSVMYNRPLCKYILC